MLESTPLGGLLEMIGDVLIAIAVVTAFGILIGAFAGGIALGFKLVSGLAG